ncbi:MAG TPA: wax ester/triacylglycerol synthase domain-containing protein [Acidimicrobiales bacterium]|nr:wax ester/triacylglycerol synthase domain-containing protein [Acidimicrobiales bacterium]
MSERPVQGADRLSDFESLLWTLERDPQLASGFANITLLDRPADVDRMRARMVRAAALLPQLRRRVFTDPAKLAPPRWVDDPEFSIDRHVRRLHLDPPGDRTQLVAAAMEFCRRSYDPEHPLWEFLLVDGLEGGAGAMVQRFHHTIADGVGMIRMSEQFIDLERDPVDPEPVDFPDSEPLPSAVGASREAFGHAVGRTIGSIQHGIDTTRSVIGDPSRLRDGARRSIGVTRALSAEVAAMGRRRSSQWTERTDDRTLRLLRIPFEDVRRIATQHGVTVNDVFVAGAAGGAGSYHRFVGSPVDELRMAMPVNTRTDRSAGGNAFGLARVLVPTDPDPSLRLTRVHEILGGARQHAAVALIENLAGVANLLPGALLVRFTRAQVASVDFTTSNVRGAPFPVYLAGALVESNHPIGPLTGTAFNLTMLSYNGSLDMGLHIDQGAIQAPDLLAQCVQLAFNELLDL